MITYARYGNAPLAKCEGTLVVSLCCPAAAAAADVLNGRIYKLTSYKRLAVTPAAAPDMQ
jgi:hypothetical protein